MLLYWVHRFTSDTFTYINKIFISVRQSTGCRHLTFVVKLTNSRRNSYWIPLIMLQVTETQKNPHAFHILMLPQLDISATTAAHPRTSKVLRVSFALNFYSYFYCLHPGHYSSRPFHPSAPTSTLFRSFPTKAIWSTSEQTVMLLTVSLWGQRRRLQRGSLGEPCGLSHWRSRGLRCWAL